VSAKPPRSAPALREHLAFAERVALYLCATNKHGAHTLLEGFIPALHAEAAAFADQALAWDSPTRQARMGRVFGPPADALERLRALVLEAPPGLRVVIGPHLPPWARVHFPHLEAATPTAPALSALAARLVREATR
jgi:hypothetical protein